jgi:hypothetical protein
MIIKQFINFQDKLYILRKTKHDDPSYTSSKLDMMNQWLGTNKILRKEGMLYFLEEVEDVEVIAWLSKES